MPRLTSKCQVTIPKVVRESLGLEPGAEVEFQFRDGEWILRNTIPESVFRKWKGYLKLAKTSDQLIHEVRGQ